VCVCLYVCVWCGVCVVVCVCVCPSLNYYVLNVLRVGRLGANGLTTGRNSEESLKRKSYNNF